MLPHDEKTIEKAINNAAASVEMEGYHIDEQSKEWCRQLLRKEITTEEYISLVKKKREYLLTEAHAD